MSAATVSLSFNSPEATARFAQKIGAKLSAGDVLLLEGDIGAGKTHFARALISSILVEPEDIPSPTFTLVQTYDTRYGTLWHADLYRLSNPDEVVELGLQDAFETAICVVEWPDRLADLKPKDALQLNFSYAGSDEARLVDGCWSDPKWEPLMKDHLDD